MGYWADIISKKASEVLINKTGICWTKSCLLAALLRANQIPSGISYQLLTIADDDSEGHMIHALNTVFVEDKWIRIDARGNNENVNAQFSLDKEQIPFHARSELGEIDYNENHADLDERLVDVLAKCESLFEIEADFELKVVASDTVYPGKVKSIVYASVNGEYKLTVGGYSTWVTVVDGSAKFDAGVFNVGFYNVVVNFSGDENFNPAVGSVLITVNQALNEITVNASDVIYGEDTIVIVVADVDGSYKVDINGTVYNITVRGGIANMTVRLDVGEYLVNVNYPGDLNHKANSSSVNVKVSKVPTNIAASAVTTVYNVGKNLVITLTDNKGNLMSGVQITVNLNGAKNYVTGKNGQVKVSTYNLAPKSYTAKITFNRNATYKKSAKSVKVTVKKATPKITAKAKTFKRTTKIKKYTITLKNNKNKVMKKVKVTLKVKGKTYAAKTNSKGKATFKITKLTKKGKYIAVVKFPGNKTYKSKSKKVKITVK